MHRWLLFLVGVPSGIALLSPSLPSGWRWPVGILTLLVWGTVALFEFRRPSPQSDAADHHRRETKSDAIADRYKGGGPPVVGG